jgi:anti-sigma regulatory factor (Ser/Thr protein kinase)
VFPAEAASASRAREFVRSLLLAHGLPDLADEVRLVVSELATNAVQHARTPFTVRLEQRRARGVLLTVQDGSASVPEPVAAGASELHGRGLRIVERTSDAWGVVAGPAGTKAVWASFATGS